MPHSRSPGTASAYVSALRLLARRELSEAQVRQRLARRGYPEDEIDTAVARLTQERAIDDRRVAEAMARTGTSIKRRGRIRVRRDIEQAGIAPAVARQAIEAVFGDLEDDVLLQAAIDRRLRGRPIADDREFQRLYRYLVSNGFEVDRILRLLESRRTRHDRD